MRIRWDSENSFTLKLSSEMVRELPLIFKN